MERYQRGHQQPVEGARPAGALLVLACAVVAVAVAVWGLNVARQQRLETATDAGSGLAAASQKDDTRDADDSDVAVTAQTFLRTLDKRSGTATDSPEDNAIAVRLAWSEDRPMTEAAADMLRAYREVPTAQLALSGYLDIKGNVWGAIVRDGRGWVDMVTVAADAGDASCRLRVIRLSPQASNSKEGS